MSDVRLYKYLPRLDRPDYGGFVTPNRFLSALDAHQYLAIPYSPVVAIEMDAVLAKGKLTNFGSRGSTQLAGLTRRAWPSFGLHGGAWELKFQDGRRIPFADKPQRGWIHHEPSLTPVDPPILLGAFLDDRDTEWGVFSRRARELAHQIFNTVPAADQDLGEGQSLPSPDSPGDPGTFKYLDGVAGGAIRFILAHSEFEYTISFLGDWDAANGDWSSIQLFGAVWRDSEVAEVFSARAVEVVWVMLSLPGQRCIRGIAREVTNRVSRIADVNAAVVMIRDVLKKAVDQLPHVLAPERRVIALPWLGNLASVVV